MGGAAKKVSVAEEEAQRQEWQCQVKQQPTKTLKWRWEERGDEFYNRQHSVA